MPNPTDSTNEIRCRGRVVEIQLGEVARLFIQLGDKHIKIILTAQRAEDMRLRPGDDVTIVIGSAELTVTKAVGED